MTLDGEDCFDNQYYLYIRRLLTAVGLWPYLETNKPYIFFISTLMFLGIFSQIYVMLKFERTVEEILELLQTIVPTILYSFCYWNLLYHSTLVRKILGRVKSDWNKLTYEDDLNIMRRYASQSKISATAIICVLGFYCACLILPSIWYIFLYISGVAQQPKYILPVYDELFIITKSTYVMAFSLEIIIIPIFGLLGMVHYSLFILFLQHSCVLFVIVTHEINRPFIKNPSRFCWEQTGTINKREAELKWIVTVVKNYNNAIKFFELIILLYGKTYIAEVFMLFGFFIVDCFYLARLLFLTISVEEILKVCFYVNGNMLTVYAYLGLGERLMEHSINVFEKCRMVPFYALTVQTNKYFLLFIMRCMKPCSISVGGVVVASHELFANMAKASFSFATLLYKMS